MKYHFILTLVQLIIFVIVVNYLMNILTLNIIMLILQMDNQLKLSEKETLYLTLITIRQSEKLKLPTFNILLK